MFPSSSFIPCIENFSGPCMRCMQYMRHHIFCMQQMQHCIHHMGQMRFLINARKSDKFGHLSYLSRERSQTTPVYLPYPAGTSFAAQSSQSDGESWRHLDRPSALATISTTWVQGSMVMMSTMGALSSRTTMMVIAIPTQRPCHHLCHIWIGWLPPLPPPTALLILHAATATATATAATTPPVEADKGGGWNSLLCPALPIEWTLPCADSDRMLRCCPHLQTR
jgi:hypothetical protein